MHPNTRQTPHSRGKMFEEYQAGVPVKVLTKRLGISRTTFYRWWKRYCLLGKAGLLNRSSRPQRILRRLSPEEESRLMTVRKKTGFGPLRLAPLLELGVSCATLYRALRKEGLNRLPHPKVPVVRYEMQHPGELVHLDVLHLFALQGSKPIQQFTLVDAYTRMAYACLATQRTTAAALQAVQRAEAFFGFPIQRVLTDNDVTFAWTPRAHFRGPKDGKARFTRILQTWGIRHSRTRIRHPQTNGKVERFHRTIREELWRPTPLFQQEEERQEALVDYLAYYNVHRPHTALKGLTPLKRREQFFAAKVSTTS